MSEVVTKSFTVVLRRNLRSEHVLWPKSKEETPLIVEIEIPNYKIDELIKTGFRFP